MAGVVAERITRSVREHVLPHNTRAVSASRSASASRRNK
jgi:hypothetical protein